VKFRRRHRIPGAGSLAHIPFGPPPSIVRRVKWSRRVLRRGAIVVIVSDGLDREAKDVLEGQMRYLRRRCYRLVWLNPYIGTDGYEPRAAGMAAALPFVDDFLPIHDLQSLHEFSRALASMPVSGRGARSHGRHA